MTVSTYTINQTTGLGGTLQVDLGELLPENWTEITEVRFTVECVADGATVPACRVRVTNASSEPFGYGTWAFSGTGVQQGGGSIGWMGLTSFSPLEGPGFDVADGAQTATWSYDNLNAVEPFVDVTAFDAASAGDSNYRLVSVRVTHNGTEPEPEPEPRVLPVRIDVYEPDNTTLVCSLTHNDVTPADARQVRELRGRVELDGFGDGELAVDFDHPQVAELTGGRFVRVVETVDEVERTPLAFRIRESREVRVPPPGQGDASRIVSVKGGGPLEVTKLGRVLPWLDVGAKPFTRRRRFDWSSPQLDTSDWTTPFDQFRLTSEPGKPFGLPALFTTKWIWGEEEADNMTIGECCFRRQFTIGGSDPVQVSAFASADDGFEDAWQGVKVIEANEPFPGKVWHKPYRSPVLLNPGTYVYAAKARNDGGKGAFICDAWSVGAAGLIDQLFMSGLPEDNELDALYGTWLCFMNPQGEWFTPGEIVRILLDECQDRGELLDVTLGFDDVEDSAGNPWPKIEFECDATGTLWDALELLAATHVDVAMSHEGLTLSMWNKEPGRGSVSSVSVQQASREIAADVTEVDYEVANDVLLVSDTTMYLYEDAASITVHGRRPGGSLQVGSIADEATLDRIGAAYLTGRTDPLPSRAVEVSPLVDFDAEPGDTITVEATSGLRVTQIGFGLAPDGQLRKQPAVESPWQLAAVRGRRLAERLIAELGESKQASRAIDTGRPGVDAGPVAPVEMESWSWRDPGELDPEYWDVAEEQVKAWQPYTAKEAARLVALIVTADWAEPDGADGLDQITTGESEFLLLRNGVATSPPFIATLPATNLDDPTDPTTFGIAFILGEGYADPNSRWSVACITNGGHANGAATIWAVDPT